MSAPLPPGLERDLRQQLARLRGCTGKRGMKPVANRVSAHDVSRAELIDRALDAARIAEDLLHQAAFGTPITTSKTKTRRTA